jgi:hypothetical protein
MTPRLACQRQHRDSIGRDQQGAITISYSSWTVFGPFHLSTVSYAVLVVDD